MARAPIGSRVTQRHEPYPRACDSCLAPIRVTRSGHMTNDVDGTAERGGGGCTSAAEKLKKVGRLDSDLHVIYNHVCAHLLYPAGLDYIRGE